MRIRSIWPGFWTSLTVTALDLPARLLFIGLWNYADDEGRGVCDYRLLKAALFPVDDDVTAAVIRGWCDHLESHRLIVRYAVGEVTYYSVRSWDEHQSPNKPRPSKCPPPPGIGTEGEGTTPGGVQIAPSGDGLLEGKGREGNRKGEDKEQPRARALGDAPAQAVTRLTRRARG